MDFLVDDLSSLTCADWPKGQYWSTSTGLPFLVPDGVHLRSPEELVGIDGYQAFAKSALEIMSEVRDLFRNVQNHDPRLTDVAETHSAHPAQESASQVPYHGTIGIVL